MTNPAGPSAASGEGPQAAPGPEVREALAERRAAAATAVGTAEREYQRIVESARWVSTDDEHDPDGPGLAVERGLLDALRVQAHAQLVALDRALERLESGRYGRCEGCGGQIGADRLAALPEALTCIDCARAANRRR